MVQKTTAKEKEHLLIPREKYLASGAHIGMTTRVAQMDKFIYKVRSNGLAVINIGELDRRIECVGVMLSKAKRPLVVCRKEIGWDVVKKFSDVTGVKFILGRFMPGSLTKIGRASCRERV